MTLSNSNSAQGKKNTAQGSDTTLNHLRNRASNANSVSSNLMEYPSRNSVLIPQNVILGDDSPNSITNNNSVTDLEKTPNKKRNSTSQESYRQKLEKQIIKKIDSRVLSLLTVIYLFSYWDKINLGLARLFNLERDLNLTQSQYSWSLSIFYVGYLSFEFCSNMVMKRISPPFWIGLIVFSWGLITCLMALIKDFKGLMIGRFFVGLSESGLQPAIIFFLSFWYTRKEQGIRIAFATAGTDLAGTIGGILGYSVSYINGFMGLKSWQWIFIFNGVPSIILGFLTCCFLPSYPKKTKWLNKTEQEILIQRLSADHINSDEKFDKKQMLEAFTDYKVFLFIIVIVGLAIIHGAMSLLLPTIIEGMGFKNIYAQLLIAPPFFFCMIGSVFFGWHSDRRHERGFHIMCLVFMTAIGFLCLAIFENVPVRYIAINFALVGVKSATGINWAWFSNNMKGNTKAGVATTLVVAFSHASGIISGQLYRASEAPQYFTSHMINFGLVSMALVAAFILRLCLKNENKKLDLMELNEESKEQLCSFRYTL